MTKFIQNRQDIRIASCSRGTVIVFPDGTKEEIVYQTTDEVDGYFLTQVQTRNIKKDGTLGKLTAWMKFRHYTPLRNQ